MKKLQKNNNYRILGVFGLLFYIPKIIVILGWICVSMLVIMQGDDFFALQFGYLKTVYRQVTPMAVVVSVLSLLITSILSVWGLKISIFLTRKNIFMKQILYFFYAQIGWLVIEFILYLPLVKYKISNLVIAGILYYCIFKRNFFTKGFFKSKK